MRRKKKEKIILGINITLFFLIALLLSILASNSSREELDEEFYVKVVNTSTDEEFYAVCFSWAQCSPNNTMSRECYSLDDLSKPIIQTKECNYQEVIHCTNGIKDFDETDIDCGGSCNSCDIYQDCKTNNDCKSANCHPLKKICVDNSEMPNFLLNMIYSHPVLMFFTLVITPAAVLYLLWLKASLEESKIKISQKNKELIRDFQSYAKLFRENVKNGNVKGAKDVFLEINRILSEMDDDTLKKVISEYNSLKEIYTKISKSND